VRGENATFKPDTAAVACLRVGIKAGLARWAISGCISPMSVEMMFFAMTPAATQGLCEPRDLMITLNRKGQEAFLHGGLQ
jgi:hypothetical protein